MFRCNTLFRVIVVAYEVIKVEVNSFSLDLTTACRQWKMMLGIGGTWPQILLYRYQMGKGLTMWSTVITPPPCRRDEAGLALVMVTYATVLSLKTYVFKDEVGFPKRLAG